MESISKGRCDYCRREDVPVRVAGSVETGSGAGYPTHACERCRDEGAPEIDGSAWYGSTDAGASYLRRRRQT